MRSYLQMGKISDKNIIKCINRTTVKDLLGFIYENNKVFFQNKRNYQKIFIHFLKIKVDK